MMFQKSPKFPPMLVFVIDVALINIAFLFAYYIRFEWFTARTPLSVPGFSKFSGVLVMVTFLWPSLFKLLGLYDKKDITSVADESSSIIGANIAATFALLALLFLYRGFWFSRGVLLYAMFTCASLMIISRYVLAMIKREMYKRGIGIRRTLIVGVGELGQGLALKMINEKELGYTIVAFLDDDPGKMNSKFHGISVIDSTVNIKKRIRELNIDEVIVATSRLPQQKMLEIVTECESEGVEFKLVPGILELIASRISTDEIGGIPLISIREIRLQGINAGLKRLSDIFFSLFALILVSPILFAVILAIKIESKGPVFFRQKRVGKDGKLFDLYKFRSMIIDAESMFEKVVAEKGGDVLRFKAKDDPRITRVGKVIRKLSIDEVPQFINVLIGDMSLVGPRPPVPFEVERYSTWHKKRLRVRPGITGLWQVSGRSEIPFEDMIRLDIYYIENWSLWMDFRIVLRTIPTVLFGSGAY